LLPYYVGRISSQQAPWQLCSLLYKWETYEVGDVLLVEAVVVEHDQHAVLAALVHELADHLAARQVAELCRRIYQAQ
jgi:hypothetical protein